MKYGLQVVQAWSPKNGVENVSKFLLNMAKEAEDAVGMAFSYGITFTLHGHQ